MNGHVCNSRTRESHSDYHSSCSLALAMESQDAYCQGIWVRLHLGFPIPTLTLEEGQFQTHSLRSPSAIWPLTVGFSA